MESTHAAASWCSRWCRVATANGVAEIHGHVRPHREVRMAVFLTLVQVMLFCRNEGSFPFFGQQVGDPFYTSAVGNADKHRIACVAFHQCGDLGLIRFPQDQVTFPEAGYGPVVGFFGGGR